MDRFTTMERLSMETNPTYGAVIKYGDRVFHTDLTWKGGFSASIYEFIDDPEETGLDAIECRLAPWEKATETFQDGGHAVAWCFGQLK